MKQLVGISIGAFEEEMDPHRALEIAKEIGADAVDFSLHWFSATVYDYRNPESVYSKGDEAVRAYFSELGAYARSLGLVISQTHGRGEGFKNLKEEDDAQVENARLDLLATSALGAPVCVIHAPTSINLGPDPDPTLMRDLHFDQYMRMLPYAAEYGVRLAVETFGDAVKFNAVDFFGDWEEFVRSYERLKKESPYRDSLTICVDTGHSNKAARFGNPLPAEVIRRLGSEITVLHLNDNNKLVDQHKIPMTGDIDWTEVMDALDEAGYAGVYNMELQLRHFGKGFEVDTAAFAIKVMRQILGSRRLATERDG